MSSDRLSALGDDVIVEDLRAPAKINLALAVGPRGDDGYHPLVSVMQQLDLCDELRVEVRRPVVDRGTHVFAPALTAIGGDSLVTRAGDAFLDALALDLEVRVRLRKRIPMGAGLGGGSSDAGTLLRLLNRLAGEPLDTDALAALAATIGSDVPFFAGGSGAALVAGRGERLAPVEGLLPSTWLVAWPGEGAPTADVYGRYEPTRSTLPPADELVRAVLVERQRFNDLTDAALATSPRLRHMWDVVTELGAHPLVCGSGSSLAVEIAEETDADPVVQALAAEVAQWPGAVLEVAETLPAP